MATPLDKYLANNLADFEGLRLSGTLPVKQEVLNDLLQTVLTDLQTPKTENVSTTPAPASTAPSVDPKRFLKYLKKAEIRAEAGRLVLDFEVSVER